MKALTLHQPWASLIACGAKRIETRSWGPPTRMVGTEFAIHAGKRKFGGNLAYDHEFLNAVDEALGPGWPQIIPYGAVVATARLSQQAYYISQAFPSVQNKRELLFGDFSPGRYIWLLSHVRAVDPPIPATGRQGFWEWSPPQGRRLL